MHSFTTNFLSLLITGLCIFFASAETHALPAGSQGPLAPVYRLSVTFDLQEQLLIGTAALDIPAGQRLNLKLAGLDITGGLLQAETGEENQLLDIKDIFILPPSNRNRTLFISYSGNFTGNHDNFISDKFISLGGLWHPIPDYPIRFELTTTLPKGFTAITEADTFPSPITNGQLSTRFSTPVTNIHFIASAYDVQGREIRPGLRAYTAFFPEDKTLAESYLDAAADFITRYEKDIGQYPYNHFIIVANRFPTGYSMPTMTLLGQAVLRLPFIKSTSLGHEIVHSWFGNSVEVDYSEGNWCEGLTAFLADHAYREDNGEGADDRKETITKYLSYVHENEKMPLSGFRSASHNQPMAEARRAVGYERGAMFFNELRYRLGQQRFSEGIRKFYADNKGRVASWSDLQTSFEAVYGDDLDTFFSNRLNRADIPDITINSAAVNVHEQGYSLNLQLYQNTDPFDLLLPVTINTMGGSVTQDVLFNEKEQNIEIDLMDRPLSVDIDPEYQLMRVLTHDETAATWSKVLGSDKLIVIKAESLPTDRYSPILSALEISDSQVRNDGEGVETELAEHDLLFLDTNSRTAREMFGSVSFSGQQFRLETHKNPYNPERVATLLYSDSRETTAALARRLMHYGKYSILEFENGRNTTKEIVPTDNGIQWHLESLPRAAKTPSLSEFDRIIAELDQTRVIYIGESHTSAADHRLQLRIIEALYHRNPQLGIGMEMFPSSSQPALDNYILQQETNDERQFLKDSRYFDVWSYDYRFFRDIILFARNNSLPVMGLNLDRDIVSEVFKNGGIENLAEDIRASLPAERDLSLAGYGDQLRAMFGMHIEGGHGNGNVNGFIQAQALWDETMAANIVSFLNNNPEYRMVVLAGSQHTRKDYGIPPRVFRRLAVPQASLINVFSNSGSDNLPKVADYVFVSEPFDLSPLPKIGVVLEKFERGNGSSALRISELSPHSKAGEADLRQGDVLQSINGIPVANMSDVRIAMLDTRTGENIELSIERKNGDKWDTISKNVTLTTPPQQMAHP